MNSEEYKKLINKYKPKENTLKNCFISFIIGGLLGLIGQLLTDLYVNILNISSKEATTLMIVTLIFLGVFLTGLGFFDKWVNFCKCGLIIPITGFAHSMMSSTMEYKKEGLVTGIGMNMFKLAGSVILYGVVAAFFVGLIRLMVGAL